MTIKFFPLFFKQSLHLDPRSVQIIYAIVPLLIAIFTSMNAKLAVYMGRVQTILLTQFIGISLLISMSVLVDLGYAQWYIIVPIYLLRSGIMNSTYALYESMLMDSVPKHQRARWKSLESVASFGWCGSAVLGGVLSDASSYSSTFFYTAGLQLIGTFIVALLLEVVPVLEKKKRTKVVVVVAGSDKETETAPREHADLEEPLLG